MTPLAKLLAAAKAYREAQAIREKAERADPDFWPMSIQRAEAYAADDLLAAARDPGLDGVADECRECGRSLTAEQHCWRCC